MDDIFAELQRIEHSATAGVQKCTGGAQKENEAEMCSEHQAPLHYYCQTCNDSICSDCAMFGKQHKNHTFERLAVVYDTHAKLIRSEISSIHDRLEQLRKVEEGIEANIRNVKTAKEERSTELQAALQEIENRLTAQLKAKLVVLLSQRNDVLKESHLLDSLLQELNCQLDTTVCPRTVLIRKSNDLRNMLKEIHCKPVSTFRDTVGDDFEGEVTPPYEGCTFIMPFLQDARGDEVVYSDPLVASGLTWRLKVSHARMHFPVNSLRV